ncbi:MAG: VWA domain-containing protein [Candidatus Nanoarchaeia archaeon]
METLVHDYNAAEKIYGDSFLRAVTGEEAATLKKKLRFPEFQRQLKSQLKEKIQDMKDEGLLDKENNVTDKGLELASLVSTMQELDNLQTKGLGERKAKKVFRYGDKENVRKYRKGDRYQDLAIKSSIKTALRRGHTSLHPEDLTVYERSDKGKIHLIYALDASGSMKGNKLGLCKKAGIALAYKAIEEKDNVGLIVFGAKVQEVVEPTQDFALFLKALSRVKAKAQTDLAATIQKAIELFPRENVTKHLIIITDAVPTVGDNPEKTTLDYVEQAANQGITVSLIGISLDNESLSFAKKLIDIGKGRLYMLKNLENLDSIVLEDYYGLK